MNSLLVLALFVSSLAMAATGPIQGFHECEEWDAWNQFPDCDSLWGAIPAESKRTIQGTAKDYSGSPIARACVVFNDKKEGDILCHSKADDQGHYSLLVPKRGFQSMAIVKNWAIDFLESWVRNIPPDGDLSVPARLGKLEIYGLVVTADSGTLSVKFTGYSLAKYLASGSLADISPELDTSNLELSIDGAPLALQTLKTEVVEIQDPRTDVTSKQRNFTLIANLKYPELIAKNALIRLVAQKNGDQGEAKYYWPGDSAP